jgi:hypothetical protein
LQNKKKSLAAADAAALLKQAAVKA